MMNTTEAVARAIRSEFYRDMPVPDDGPEDWEREATAAIAAYEARRGLTPLERELLEACIRYADKLCDTTAGLVDRFERRAAPRKGQP